MRRMITNKQINKLENAPEIVKEEESVYAIIVPVPSDPSEYAKLYLTIDSDGQPQLYGIAAGGQSQGLTLGTDGGDPVVSIDNNGLNVGNIITVNIEDGAVGTNSINLYDDDTEGITISCGQDTGILKILHLPTSDPHVKGALWNDNGVLKISAGE